jgi:outer membrane protein TolC
LEQEVAKLDAERKKEEKRMALLNLLGLKPGASVELSGEIPPEVVPADRLDWYRDNAAQALDAKRAALTVDEKKQVLEQTRLQGGLTGTLMGSADIGRGKEKRDVTNNINTNRYGVSLTLNYPLWDGGAQAAAERAAEVAYETANLDREKQIQAAVTKVTSAINKVTTGQKRVELLGRIAELERQRLARAEEQKEQGLLSAKAFADLKISALEAQAKYLQAVADHDAAVYELHQSFLEDTPPEILR